MEGGGLFLVGGHGRNGCGGRKSGLDGLVSSPKVKETLIKIHPRRSLQCRFLRARSADFRDPEERRPAVLAICAGCWITLTGM